MDLTDEQKQIIALSQIMQNNEILAIQACAGSGKTSTLKEIALANPNARFLYLAFNKAIVVESKSKFPKNVEVKTIHSIAYNYTRNKIGDFKPEGKLTYFHLKNAIEFEDNRYQTYNFALTIFDDFLKSAKSFEDLSQNHRELVKYLFELTLKGELPITHNFYLKLYEMASDKQLDYDFILLDEAQDTNEVMLNIFLSNDCKKILVGDSFQNIYGFNNSINAFEVVKANHYATLSKSFRCKQQILDYANFLLSEFSAKPFIKMTSGFTESSQIIINKAFITRTNAEIVWFLNRILESSNIDDFCLLKEPNKIFAPIWAIIHFRNAKFDLIPKEYAYIKQFKNTSELYKYIKDSCDIELLNATYILNTNIHLLQVSKLANKLFRNKKNATNFIINAHQAKGMEWDCVELAEDFSDLHKFLIQIKKEKNSQQKEELKKQFIQELNLFYVAITRAKKQLIDNSKNLILYQQNIKDWTISFGTNISDKMKLVKGGINLNKKIDSELEEQIENEIMIEELNRKNEKLQEKLKQKRKMARKRRR